jgi:hypothetical protein
VKKTRTQARVQPRSRLARYAESIDELPQTSHRGYRINRRITRYAPEILGPVVGNPANLGHDPFGGETERLSCGSPHDRPKRQNSVVYCDEVNHVARLSTPTRRADFLGGKVDRMPSVSEGLIPNCGKKAEVAVAESVIRQGEQ